MSTGTDTRSLRSLRAHLDGEHSEIRDRVRATLADNAGLLDDPSEMSYHEHRERVLEMLRAMASSGDTGLGFPTEFGGGGDVGASIAAFETLAYGDLSLLVKSGVQFGLFGGAVLHLGTRRHHERYLRDIVSGRLLGCFAMTETGHGSNVQALRTTATYDDGHFVIDTPDDDARKDYIGNAALHGRLAVVFAQLVVGDSAAGEPRGVHALLVPIRSEDGTTAPGVRIEDCGAKLGLGGVDNGRLWFDGVRVPAEALLDRYATVDEAGTYRSSIENPDRRFFTMLGTLVQGRVSVSGAAQSASKLALTIAVRYGSRRRQFGPPDAEHEVLVLDYLAHQRRLFPLLAKSYALHFAQRRLASWLADTSADDDRRELESYAAGLKAISTWHTTETVQTCREACGGAGYLSTNRFTALKADTDVFTTFEGDNTVLLQLVAKGLLTQYRDEFGRLDPLGMVRFAVGQAVGTVMERTAVREIVERLRDAVPGTGPDSDDAGLFDREYHLEMLRWREDHVLGGLARRLKRGIDADRDPFEVFNSCQDHVLACARAHVDRLVMEAFADGCDGRPELELLCSLYALHTIESDRGWFQEHGRLSGARSKSITAAVNRLCGQVREHAEALVDAFGIPDALLPELVRGDGTS